MKNNLLVFLILISITTFAQKNELNGENIKVSFDNRIESKKISISLSQGTWNVILFSLFKNNIVVDNTFPKEAGNYRLTINYADELYYNEVIIYKVAPNFEKLQFDFYQDCGRLFCRITSDYVTELNKEVVLNKLSKEKQDILKSTKH